MDRISPMRIWRTAAVTACLTLSLLTHDASLQNARPAGTITEASVRGHMEVLAGDAMMGRGSGTEDEWRAADYIGQQMKRWGIEPLGDNGGYVKKIATTRMIVTAPPTLTLGQTKLEHGREMIVQSIGRGTVSGATYTYKAGAAAPANAVVIVPEGVTPAPEELQSAAVILTAETPQIRANWKTLASQRAGMAAGGGRRGAPPAPPVARIILSSAAYKTISAMPAGTTADFSATTGPGFTSNAIGRLKGSDPALAEEVILLTAHLDHLGVRGTTGDIIYNGADDDASGSTAVLALAEALAKGPRPKRTVIFAWFGSEESGGAGARDFLDHPPVPLTQIAANLEFEMIANRDAAVPPHTLWLTGYDCSTLGPDLAKQGAKIVNDPHPEEGFFNRSDNAQLARRGVVAQTVSSFDVKRQPSTYHQLTDEVSTVDFAHMTDAIQSMLAPVLWLANSDYKPKWLDGKDPSKGGNCGARPGRGGV